MTSRTKLAMLGAALLVLPQAMVAAQDRADGAPVSETLVGDALPGAFFMKPEGDGPFPALILLGGSEGGDSSARRKAPHFLEHGYGVLGLPYYSPAWGRPAQFPELPQAFDAIPVEKAEIARAWLAARADVRGDDIGIYGASKGAEFALLAGAHFDGFAAIAAIVPSDVVWEGWGPGTSPGAVSSFSLNGEPLPFVPYIGMQEAFAEASASGTRARLRIPHDRGRHAFPERAVAARIAVEAIDEPVLVAGGDADNVWNSGEMAQAIAERRAEAGLDTVSLIFTDAGHALSGTGAPSDWASEDEVEAQKIIWPATLEFLAAHLKD
ncbi:alpha/beta hydrolase family protein [Qipengyuania nanhaisediminis]|uniref:alpha/beta hydrolase family protein n=1 Tax=Qipengyuania nanhaisediminis TaxID=604088 RepID=UPI0038B402BF